MIIKIYILLWTRTGYHDSHFQYKNVHNYTGFQSAESELIQTMLPRYTRTSIQAPYLVHNMGKVESNTSYNVYIAKKFPT